TRRMQDNREEKVVSMVDVNMGIMRNALQATAATPPNQKFRVLGTDWNASANWTRAVYVAVERPDRGYTTTSDIPAIQTGTNNGQPVYASSSGTGTGKSTATAVRLVNAKLLPTLASATVDKGLTFATNAPVYVAGHFNANGVVSNSGAA